MANTSGIDVVRGILEGGQDVYEATSDEHEAIICKRCGEIGIGA